MAKKEKTTKVEIHKKILTPQQELFLSLYTNPKSPTFSNGHQSALKAGYAEEYAQNMISQLPEWLSTNISDLKRLQKAEQILDDTMELNHIVPAMGAFGPVLDKKTGKPIMTVSTAILREKGNTARFVAETLGKNKYGKKMELVAGFGFDDVKDYD